MDPMLKHFREFINQTGFAVSYVSPPIDQYLRFKNPCSLIVMLSIGIKVPKREIFNLLYQEILSVPAS